jgi:ElaB/YqjD/DUF883 family membrane-anchored ribosome-binding protein
MAAETTSASRGKNAEIAASKEAAMEAYEKLLEARQHFRRAAEAAGLDARDEAMEQFARGREKAEAIGAEAGAYVRQRPLASLGLAFLAGYILAQVFGRR